MRVFVIGGTRFMGLRLAQNYSADLHDVVTFTRTGAPSDTGVAGPIGHLKGDRRESGALKRAIQESKPDLVVDMMCMTEQDALDLVDARTCPFVVASSCDVYRNFAGVNGTEQGEPDPVPLTEDSPLRSNRYPYRGSPRAEKDPWINDYDKILVENVVLPAGGCVVRLPMVIGPNDYQHRLYDYLRRMDDGREAILLGKSQAEWRACRGYVEDMARAIALAGASKESQGVVYNAAYEQAWTEREWVEAVGKESGWKGRVVVVEDEALPEHLKQSADFRFDVSVSSRKIREELGYAERRPFAEALRATIAWERENPPANAPDLDYDAEDKALALAG